MERNVALGDILELPHRSLPEPLVNEKVSIVVEGS